MKVLGHVNSLVSIHPRNPRTSISHKQKWLHRNYFPELSKKALSILPPFLSLSLSLPPSLSLSLYLSLSLFFLRICQDPCTYLYCSSTHESFCRIWPNCWNGENPLNIVDSDISILFVCFFQKRLFEIIERFGENHQSRQLFSSFLFYKPVITTWLVKKICRDTQCAYFTDN